MNPTINDKGASAGHSANDTGGPVPTGRRGSRLRVALLTSAGGAGILALVIGVAYFGPIMSSTHGPGAAAYAAPVETGSAPGPIGFADIVTRVKPAVISVRVRINEIVDASETGKSSPPLGSAPEHGILVGEGSGFFISPDGYAVTNDHVVDHANSVKVTTSDGSVYDAKVVGIDAKSDLALLRVNAHRHFAFVKFAAHKPRVGDWVVAVGNPFGLGGTVTAGIISAQGRDIGGSYDDYLQIDAPINRGNSGGPAFNLNGNVVGVNTAIFSPSGGSVGIGFDIPADTVERVIDQLKTKGYVRRGWLGIQMQPVTADIADGLGMKEAAGVLVDDSQADSPAARAGIRAGDVITGLNGEAIKDPRGLARKIARLAPGSETKLGVLRNGESETIAVKLAETPKPEREAKAQSTEPQQQKSAVAHLGLALAPAQNVAGSGVKGVVVLGVDPNGSAAEKGMQSGDVILDVSGKPVQDPSEVREALAQSRAKGKHTILMRLKTAQGTRFVALPIGQG